DMWIPLASGLSRLTYAWIDVDTGRSPASVSLTLAGRWISLMPTQSSLLRIWRFIELATSGISWGTGGFAFSFIRDSVANRPMACAGRRYCAIDPPEAGRQRACLRGWQV